MRHTHHGCPGAARRESLLSCCPPARLSCAQLHYSRAMPSSSSTSASRPDVQPAWKAASRASRAAADPSLLAAWPRVAYT